MESNALELSIVVVVIVIIIIINAHLNHVYNKTDLSQHCSCLRSLKLFKMTFIYVDPQNWLNSWG